MRVAINCDKKSKQKKVILTPLTIIMLFMYWCIIYEDQVCSNIPN